MLSKKAARTSWLCGLSESGGAARFEKEAAMGGVTIRVLYVEGLHANLLGEGPMLE